MVVIRRGQGGGKSIPDGSPPQVDAAEGFIHDHGASYFRATVESDALKDPKSGTLDFRATLVFTLPNGDTRYLKGFEYPEGVIGDALDRFIECSFKESTTLGQDQMPVLAWRIRWMLSTIPPLSFNTEDDRRDYEKALHECFLSCQRMEQATGKDIASAADQCKSALKDFQNQARDSRGALIGD